MHAWGTIVATWKLWRRCHRRSVSARDVRDSLLCWYSVQAREFLLRGMRYSDPHGDASALRRRIAERTRAFFKGLDSSYERPTLADLRVVQRRMRHFSHPRWTPRVVERAQERLLEEIFARAWREDPESRTHDAPPPPPPAPPPEQLVSPPRIEPEVLPDWVALPEDPWEVFDSRRTMRLRSGLIRDRAPVAPRPPGR